MKIQTICKSCKEPHVIGWECSKCGAFLGGLFNPASSQQPGGDNRKWVYCPYCAAPLIGQIEITISTWEAKKIILGKHDSYSMCVDSQSISIDDPKTVSAVFWNMTNGKYYRISWNSSDAIYPFGHQELVSLKEVRSVMRSVAGWEPVMSMEA